MRRHTHSKIPRNAVIPGIRSGTDNRVACTVTDMATMKTANMVAAMGTAAGMIMKAVCMVVVMAMATSWTRPV